VQGVPSDVIETTVYAAFGDRGSSSFVFEFDFESGAFSRSTFV
jgi:hypothetical protein